MRTIWRICGRISFFAAVVWLALAAVSPSYAGNAYSLQPSAPTHGGTDRFVLNVPGVGRVRVDVTLTDEELAGLSATERKTLKGQNIAAAINAKVPGSASVDNFGNVTLNGARCVYWISGTGENQDLIRQDPPTGFSADTSNGLQFASGFTSLTGVDAVGGAATYTAGFEYLGGASGDISLFTSLTFADLTNPTLTGVLQQEYDNLQSQLLSQDPSLVSRLTLDLSSGSIVFAPSGTYTSVSSTSGTTDTALENSSTVCDCPEPSSLLLLATAPIASSCFGVWRRRRRLASPSSQA